MTFASSTKQSAAALAETAGVALLVFALGWIGARLAAAARLLPVTADHAGVVELRLAASERRGAVSFQEANYTGWWHCEGTEWVVEWRFAVDPARPYTVEALVSAGDEVAGGKIAGDIRQPAGAGELHLESVLPEFPKGNWKTIPLGEVKLGSGAHILTVHPASSGLTNLNLKSVVLRPKSAA